MVIGVLNRRSSERNEILQSILSCIDVNEPVNLLEAETIYACNNA